MKRERKNQTSRRDRKRAELKKRFAGEVILMPMHEVDSSNLAMIGYDKETERLSVLFRSGLLYQYADVASSLVRKLERSASKGEFFSRWICDLFPYVVVGRLKLPKEEVDLIPFLTKSLQVIAKSKASRG